jgi:hypothetical protein
MLETDEDRARRQLGDEVVDHWEREDPQPTDELDEYKLDQFVAEDRMVEEPDINDPPTGPDQSVEIGGPQVEAAIAEIKEVQRGFENEEKELVSKLDKLADDYFKNHPDLDKDERTDAEGPSRR